MNIADVVMKSRNVESFNNLLPVTSVTSEKSKAVASRNGYMALYTADELRKISKTLMVLTACGSVIMSWICSSFVPKKLASCRKSQN